MKRKQAVRADRLQSGKALRQKNDITPTSIPPPSQPHPNQSPTTSTNPLLNINFLQQKFSQQKRILSMQARRLQQKLLKQININQQRRFEFEKKQQRYISQIQALQNQNQALKNKLQLQLQQQKDPDSSSFYTHEQQQQHQQQQQQQQQQRQKQHLINYKQLILKYKQLQQDYHQLQQALILQDEQKHQLKLQNDQLVKHNENIKLRVLKDQVEFNKVKELLQTYAKEKEMINSQFEQYEQRVRVLEVEVATGKERLQEQKRRKKQTQKQLLAIEQKFALFQTQSTLKYQHRLAQAVQQAQLQKQKYLQLNTKLSFTEISLQKKQSYLQQLQSLLREVKQQKDGLLDRCQKQEKQMVEMRDQLVKVNNNMFQMKEGFEEEKVVMARKHQDEIAMIKKKTIEEIYPILKDKNEERSKKNLQQYLKTYKSSSSFLKLPFNLIQPLASQSDNQQLKNPMQKFKLQSQINSLQMQKLNMRKQHDLLTSQLSNLKTHYTQLRTQLDTKSKQCHQLQSKIDKLQHSKSTQLLNLRKQLSQLKSKQTQALQLMRDRQQYQEAMNLKIVFYDKKIKELLETIERKEGIIDKLKMQRGEMEEKVKFYQQKIQRLVDEVDNMKRAKGDLTRKDQLMRDYRNRYEKAKAQQQQLKQAIQTLRKDKQKLQNALDSKQDYINSLKKKQIKDLQQIQKTTQDKIKSTENKLNKNIKENYQGKIKRLKKDLQAASQGLGSIKRIVIEMVENFVRKGAKSKHNQSQAQFQNYQAAKLLGLNANEIESFLNPSKAMDQGILDQLENLWSEEDFANFAKQSLNYILSKSQ